jgi:predicted methyltransferase
MDSHVLSHFQAKSILSAHDAGLSSAVVSLDLGLTQTDVHLQADFVVFPDGQRLSWLLLREILANELACYEINDDQIEKIHYFSQTFNRYYSLMPTNRAPTMLISGIPMHRIKNTDPTRDTLNKIKTVTPIAGHVLDTTMGLGYTAIEAAKSAEKVTVIELDPTVVEVCRHNPWSRGLFNNPRITRLIGDSYELVEQFAAETFTRIVHDPPMFNLAGELYSTTFYRQLLRILRPSGRMFHYIGNPSSKSGRGVTRGAIRRLYEAGFRRIKPYPRAFGVVAFK